MIVRLHMHAAGMPGPSREILYVLRRVFYKYKALVTTHDLDSYQASVRGFPAVSVRFSLHTPYCIVLLCIIVVTQRISFCR